MSTVPSIPPTRPAPLPKALQFVFGGSAGMAATCVVQPIDLIKTRMQLAGTPAGRVAAATTSASTAAANTTTAATATATAAATTATTTAATTATSGARPTFTATAREIVAREGVSALYRGLSAGLFRQVTYTTARLGIFGVIKDALAPADGSPLPFTHKAFAGMVAGGLGAVVGTPAEVALVRMTADGRLPVEQRRNYSSVFNALARVVREEGVTTLWRGTMPTVGRAVVLNIAQLASYDQAKEAILKTGVVGDNIGAHALASTCSGFLATAVSIPLDNAKTRVQNMKVIDGKPEYTGMVDALARTVRSEGIFSLWRGFTPYFLRLGPHTVITFIILEQMKSTYTRSLSHTPR